MLVLLRLLEFVCERVTLLFHGAKGLGHSELPLDFTSIELRLQFLDFGVLCGGSTLQLAGDFGLGKFDSILLVLLGQLKALVQLHFELAVANLLQDVRVTGLVDLERLPAVRTDDFIHGNLPSALARIWRSISGTVPSALSVAARYPSWFFARVIPAAASRSSHAFFHSGQSVHSSASR